MTDLPRDELRTQIETFISRWYGGEALSHVVIAQLSTRLADFVLESGQVTPGPPTRHVANLKAAERARIQLEGDGCVTALDELGSYLDGYDNALDDLARTWDTAMGGSTERVDAGGTP